MIARQYGNGDGLYLRLEVLPGASHDEIARAYRRLAHDAHPDSHPGDPDAARRFREITEAYEVLGNPDRRKRYDLARRQVSVSTNRASPGPDESSPAPGPAQVFASPTVTGGPPVFLGTAPVTNPAFQLSGGPVQVGPSTARASPVVCARRRRRGLIGAVAVRRLRAKVQVLMEWPERRPGYLRHLGRSGAFRPPPPDLAHLRARRAGRTWAQRRRHSLIQRR